jgi:predicted Fe-Mo cluster-binding NifX family protein
MYTIAISVFGSRVSVRLDSTEYIMLFSVENGFIKDREKVYLYQTNPLGKINKIKKLMPNILICGGLTETYKNMLLENNIKIVPWICGDTEDVLSQYLAGKLKTNHVQKKQR